MLLLQSSLLTCSSSLNTKDLLVHIRHTVLEVRDNDGFHDLASDTKTDLILTLVEASRLPGMIWKRFAIDQAKEAVRGLNDKFLQFCIAQRECLFHRIRGDINQTASVIDITLPASHHLPVEKRVHSEFDQSFIQLALNRIQVDDLAAAANALDI